MTMRRAKGAMVMPRSRETAMPEWNGISAGSLSEEALNRMRRYRQDRLRRAMAKRNLPALLLYDPVNIRYATDARHMQVYALNHDARYLFLALEGPTILFDWVDGDLYFGHLPTIDDVRIGQPYGFVADGDTGFETSLKDFAGEIASLIRQHCDGESLLAIDRLNPFAAQALAREGITVVDGQGAVYEARSIKSAEEIQAMRVSMACCDDGFNRMREGWRPGMSEVEMWALLHRANIEWEGEWINARYLVSGRRTNPWSQEASLKVIEADEIIGCDSDLIGPYGYASDISRTWIADGVPTDRQRRLYAASYAHLQANVEMCRPGVGFLELMERSHRLPTALSEQMFSSFAHGIGLENEWPIIRYAHKADPKGGYGGGYDGVLQPGMTLCIESYVGEIGGPDGIKLEEQIVVTEGAPISLSSATFETAWL